MYKLTAPVTQRQLKLTQEYDRLERLSFRYPSQVARQEAIIAEIEQIEQEKKQRVAA